MNEDRQSGFTLLEMLVALTLLGLLSTFAVMSLSSLSHVKQVESRMEGTSDVETAQRYLRHSVSDARVIFTVDDSAAAKLAFSGEPDRLSFVSALNDQVERGGLYWFTYKLDHESLVLDYQLFRPERPRSAGKKEILLPGITAVSFRYFGPSNEAGTKSWSSTWARSDALPETIEINIDFQPGDQRKWEKAEIEVR